MRVGIITISQGTNYGNRLQIYALQKTLRDMGHEPYLILNESGLGIRFRSEKEMIKQLINKDHAREKARRQKSFNEFDQKYLTIYSKPLNDNYHNSDIGNHFDTIICGSDQVWNPDIPYLNGVPFADFSGNFRRVSYAASFGVNSIPQEKKDSYKRWLSRFDALSVREDAGQSIIKDLLGIEVPVLVDPTMLLKSTDWERIEEKPEWIDDDTDYAFTYFLGQMSDKVKEYALKIQQKNKLAVVNALPGFQDKNFALNPAHFIYLLHNSKVVLTDSYHATVFSILFNKQFRVYERNNVKGSMSSRLDTLMGIFHLEQFRGSFNEKFEESIDYSPDSKLATEREKAIRFLTKSIY